MDYVLITHNAWYIQQDEDFSKGHILRDCITPFNFDTSDLMVSNPCLTLTTAFRNGLVRDFPPIYYEGIGDDRRLYLLISMHGKCRYVPDVVGVYRTHTGGATRRVDIAKGKFADAEELIRHAKNWDQHLDSRYDHEVDLVRVQQIKAFITYSLMNIIIRKAIHNSRFADPADFKNYTADGYCMP